MVRAVAIWFAIIAFGLAIGMAGYAGLEGLSLVDAYLNAAMILSGMGPATELKTTGGKLFAGSYAIFSGLIIIISRRLRSRSDLSSRSAQVSRRDAPGSVTDTLPPYIAR